MARSVPQHVYAILLVASLAASASEVAGLMESSEVHHGTLRGLEPQTLGSAHDGSGKHAKKTTGQKNELEKLAQKLAEKDKQLAQKDKQLAQKDKRLAQKDKQLARVKRQRDASRRLGDDAGGRKLPLSRKLPRILYGKGSKKRGGGSKKRGTKCHKTCKTCMDGPTRNAAYRCTSCKGYNTVLAVRKYSLDGQGNPKKGSEVGTCKNPTKHRRRRGLVKKVSASGGPGIACAFSGCNDGSTGWALASSEARQIACSRVCLIGGRMTWTRNLKRTDGKKLEAKYKSPGKGKTKWDRGSSPVCTFRKVVLCTKPANFDAKKCAKGDKTRCEACRVKKALKCHAVVPFRFTGTSYTGYTDICKYVKDPCAPGGRSL